MASTKNLHHLGLMLLGAVVCVLCLTASPASFAQSPFTGVYTGTFFGPRDSGQFAVLVRTNSVAIVMAFDNFDELGFVNQNVTINPNGSFVKSNIDGEGTSASGTFTATEVNGTFVDRNGFTGTFHGTKQPGNGSTRDVGGFYSGTIAGTLRLDDGEHGRGPRIGTFVGTFSGDWHMLIAANGVLFQLIEATASAVGQVERVEVGVQQTGVSADNLCGSINLAVNLAVPLVRPPLLGDEHTCSFDPNTFTFSGRREEAIKKFQHLVDLHTENL